MARRIVFTDSGFWKYSWAHLVGMGDMGLEIYHDISGIYCYNDINDDNSGNPVSLAKSIIFPVFTPNRVL